MPLMYILDSQRILDYCSTGGMDLMFQHLVRPSSAQLE